MSKTKYPVFKCLHRGEKGFTLIELIIVVAIIGILAAVIVPHIGRFLAVGEKGAAEGELRSVQNAVLAAMATAGVSHVAGGIVSNTSGAIGGGLSVVPYLHGGIAQLRGSWNVTTTGLVVSGRYPAIVGPHWAFTAPGTWVRHG